MSIYRLILGAVIGGFVGWYSAYRKKSFKWMVLVAFIVALLYAFIEAIIKYGIK